MEEIPFINIIFLKGVFTMTSKGNLIRVLGFVATIGGVVASLLGDWVEEKKIDEMIGTKLDERLAKKENLMMEDGNDEDEDEE